MSIKPIIFSRPMVLALIDGCKTQTRRVLKPQPDSASISKPFHPESRGDRSWVFMARTDTPGYSYAIGDFKVPYAVGDLLWVRETWCAANSDDGPVLLTRADHGRRYITHESYPVDYEKYPAGKGAWMAWAGDVEAGTTKAWRPAIFMPRWASRLTLEVTGVKVERLQDISEEDAQAEGAPRLVMDDEGKFYESAGGTHRCGFAGLWDHINGKDPAKSWDANPWVVAVTFKVHRCNVMIISPEEKAA